MKDNETFQVQMTGVSGVLRVVDGNGSPYEDISLSTKTRMIDVIRANCNPDCPAMKRGSCSGLISLETNGHTDGFFAGINSTYISESDCRAIGRH